MKCLVRNALINYKIVPKKVDKTFLLRSLVSMESLTNPYIQLFITTQTITDKPFWQSPRTLTPATVKLYMDKQGHTNLNP